MQKGLVSILTPCYNTGSIVHRLLDSILVQDYPKVEMFAIDDGSIDNTSEVIKSYIPIFKEKGYQLTYIYQDNSGQSVAINEGLKLVDGEFLMWPDSDDYYCDSAFISKMVQKMTSDCFALGRCRIQYVDENLHYRGVGDFSSILQSPDQFDNFVFGLNGILYPPVAYMANMKILDRVIPQREIYTEQSAGQNWQLMLPLSYNAKCFYLDDICAYVLIRSSSHSRGQFLGYSSTLFLEAAYERTGIETINRMPHITDSNRQYYIAKLKLHFIHRRMKIALGYRQSKDAVAYAKQYDNQSVDKLSPIVHLMTRYCECFPLYITLRIIRKVLRIDL